MIFVTCISTLGKIIKRKSTKKMEKRDIKWMRCLWLSITPKIFAMIKKPTKALGLGLVWYFHI